MSPFTSSNNKSTTTSSSATTKTPSSIETTSSLPSTSSSPSTEAVATYTSMAVAAAKVQAAANIMSYQHVIVVLAVLLCGLTTANGLKCHMCGQYNEGVGSITPCLNYSDSIAHLYLKECPKKTEKFCVKYVSELSIVRDCATECAEKEIWETQTYCCNQDGCNGSRNLRAPSSMLLLMLPVLYYIMHAMFNKCQVIKVRR